MAGGGNPSTLTGIPEGTRNRPGQSLQKKMYIQDTGKLLCRNRLEPPWPLCHGRLDTGPVQRLQGSAPPRDRWGKALAPGTDGSPGPTFGMWFPIGRPHAGAGLGEPTRSTFIDRQEFQPAGNAGGTGPPAPGTKPEINSRMKWLNTNPTKYKEVSCH